MTRELVRHARELDLSGLELGDCHPLMREFHSFPHLATLILRNNDMGPKGTRWGRVRQESFTLPRDVFNPRNLVGPAHLARNRGLAFRSLRHLDISANPGLAAACDLERVAGALYSAGLEVLVWSLSQEEQNRLGRHFKRMFDTKKVRGFYYVQEVTTYERMYFKTRYIHYPG